MLSSSVRAVAAACDTRRLPTTLAAMRVPCASRRCMNSVRSRCHHFLWLHTYPTGPRSLGYSTTFAVLRTLAPCSDQPTERAWTTCTWVVSPLEPDNPKVIKTSLGAEATVPATSCKDITECLTALRTDGFEVWAVDYTARSVPLQDIEHRPERLAFVVGNERAGVDPLVLEQANKHVHLDMYGTKTTLNVGVTFGVVAYWLRTLGVAT